MGSLLKKRVFGMTGVTCHKYLPRYINGLDNETLIENDTNDNTQAPHLEYNFNLHV